MADAAVATLTGLGFPAALARRALQLENGDVERAADMLLTNPPPVDQAPTVIDADHEEGDVHVVGSNQHSNPSHAMLVEMGFDARAAAQALDQTHGNLEAAVARLTGMAPQESSPHAPLSESHRYPAPIQPLGTKRTESSESLSTSSAKQAKMSTDTSQAGLDAASSSKASPRSACVATPQAKRTDNIHTVEYVASDLVFGSAAFGQLRHDSVVPEMQSSSSRSSALNIKKMVEASVPDVKRMMGERDRKYVTQMLTDCYHQGLFTHGGPTSPVNSQVIPAMHYIFGELDKRPANDGLRVKYLTELAYACQDCQQVQAREILRIFADLTSQNDTFEGQLKYSLVRQKEAALSMYITRHHKKCDEDHVRAHPWQQRAHLISGYVELIGDQFGLDGVTAAKSDRFLGQVQSEIGRLRAKDVIEELKRDMSPKEWLQTLLADINNQTSGSERLINRDCIFKWVEANMGGDAAHSVFYDEERAEEFEDLDPKMPTDENRYQPFLSPKVLVDMLLNAGMVEKKPLHARRC